MFQLSIITLLSLSAPPGSIDGILEPAWKAEGITAPPICSDEQFLRRASLDIIGRIPTMSELRQFRRDPDRSAKIDQLLASRQFPRFWSEIWTSALNGYTNAFDSDREVLRSWLEQALVEDLPYDELVRRLITARGDSAFNGPTNFLVRHPREPTVKVCRLFLGVRLDCARCHDHPFDRWTEEDFAMMNRFFEATDRREVSEGNIRLVNQLPPANQQRPRFLSGARPRTTQWRDELGLFITSSKPFARTFANRLWYHFMGRGIVDPTDDFHAANPPSVPALLEFLTQQAREDRFAVRPMIRLICSSRAYQLESSHSKRSDKHESLFARRLLKPLTPEQTYDSVAIGLGIEPDERDRQRFVRRMVGQSLDEDFSQTWEYRETVPALLARLTSNIPVPTSDVNQLYRRILSRDPTPQEKRRCQNQSAEDIAFALVNSNEFFFNH